MSLAKIRELHGGYKSICDSFAINLTEFETIFTSNDKMFAIWDTDNNGRLRLENARKVVNLYQLHEFLCFAGLIDALELFAGIIIFADAQAEDKLRCK